MAIEDAFRNLTTAQRQAALEGPALMPSPGIVPNFTNPPNQNELGYGLIYSCAVVCAVVVCIRLYASLICRKKMNIEDCKSARRNHLEHELKVFRLGHSSTGSDWRLPLYLVPDPPHARPLRSPMGRPTQEPCYNTLRTFNIHPYMMYLLDALLTKL